MNTSLTSSNIYSRSDEKSINLEIFDFRVSTGLIRYGVILLLSIIITHIRYGLLPFYEAYVFPWTLFLNIFSFGFILCTTSWVVTNLFKRRIFKSELFEFRNVVHFLAINAGVVIIVFTGLFIYRNYPRPFSPTFFLAYLMISSAVVTIENLLFLVYAMYHAKREKDMIGTQEIRTSLLISTGRKSLNLEFDRISHIQLEEGIIVFHTTDDQRVNTQFNTLDQVAKELPGSKFYRANRQFILHRNAIKYISKDKNRKLLVHINGQVPSQEIIVSRYKNKEIKDWLNMKPAHE